MSAKKVLIYSDLDGTLLDHYSYLATAAMPTLAQLKKANIPVILNTSKTLAELEVIRQELQLNTPFIIENGAAVYIPVSALHLQPAGTITLGNYWVKAFCLPLQHWLNLLTELNDDFGHYFQGFSTLSIEELCDATGLSPAEAKRAKNRQYGEPVLWHGDEATKQQFMERLIDLGASVVQGGRFIHIGGFCDKGQALIWLTEQYREQFSAEDIYTIALGDGENDTAMLEAADFAVQVRSPVHDFPNLFRQYNTTRTQQYGPEGWALAIEKLLAPQLLSH